jgi:hypothetical protein
MFDHGLLSRAQTPHRTAPYMGFSDFDGVSALQDCGLNLDEPSLAASQVISYSLLGAIQNEILEHVLQHGIHFYRRTHLVRGASSSAKIMEILDKSSRGEHQIPPEIF